MFSNRSVSIAIVLGCVFVATDGSVSFSSKTFSGLSIMTDFSFFASFAMTREAIFFFEAVETGRTSPYFPKPVATDLGTLDLGLVLFRDK